VSISRTGLSLEGPYPYPYSKCVYEWNFCQISWLIAARGFGFVLQSKTGRQLSGGGSNP